MAGTAPKLFVSSLRMRGVVVWKGTARTHRKALLCGQALRALGEEGDLSSAPRFGERVQLAYCGKDRK